MPEDEDEAVDRLLESQKLVNERKDHIGTPLKPGEEPRRGMPSGTSDAETEQVTGRRRENLQESTSDDDEKL
ncbi:MAG: hypothetical protein ACYDDF_07170 [Thermoplasmatota archaeon]